MEFVCFVWILEQTANFALHCIKRLAFITEVDSVYCAVRTEPLYNTDRVNYTVIGHLIVIGHWGYIIL